jgi:hypothetical protein
MYYIFLVQLELWCQRQRHFYPAVGSHPTPPTYITNHRPEAEAKSPAWGTIATNENPDVSC